MNPFCPNCGEMLKLKKLEESYVMMGRRVRVLNRYWVCESCKRSVVAKLTDRKWKWKVGAEVIRYKKKKKGD